MARLVGQGLRKLVNQLMALNDERRDFSGQQERIEPTCGAIQFHTVHR